MASTRGYPKLLSPLLSLASLGLLVALVGGVLWFLGVLAFPSFQRIPSIASSEYELVFSELDLDSTIIWASNPDDSGQRRSLVEILHEPHFGIRATFSPDGEKVAYTFLPRGTKNIDSGASLGVVYIDGGGTSTLAESVDLHGIPLWSADSQHVLYRRVNSPQNGELQHVLSVVDIKQSKAKSLLVDDTSLGIYPFGWSKDGLTVYYSRLSAKGTEVMGLNVTNGRVSFIGHPSWGVARDFQLSSNGKEILFSAPKTLDAGTSYMVGSISVDGKTTEILEEGLFEYYHPIWRPDGSGVTLSSDPKKAPAKGGILDVERDGVAASSVLTAPVAGFDIPLAWSPDGRYLAIRYLVGESSQRISGESLVVFSSLGKERHIVGTTGYVEFIGWLAKGQ